MIDWHRTPYDSYPELWSHEDEPENAIDEEDDVEEPPEQVYSPPPPIRGVEWPYTLDAFQRAVGIKPWE